MFYSSVPLALLLTSSIAIFVLLAISPAMLPGPPAIALATDKVDVFVDGFCLCQKGTKHEMGFHKLANANIIKNSITPMWAVQ